MNEQYVECAVCSNGPTKVYHVGGPCPYDGRVQQLPWLHDSLREDRDRLARENEELRVRRDNACDNYETMQEERDSYKEANASHRDQRNELACKLSGVQGDLDVMRAERDRLQAENVNIAIKNNENSQRADDLEVERDRFQARVGVLDDEKRSLLRRELELTGAVVELSARVEDLTRMQGPDDEAYGEMYLDRAERAEAKVTTLCELLEMFTEMGRPETDAQWSVVKTLQKHARRAALADEEPTT